MKELVNKMVRSTLAVSELPTIISGWLTSAKGFLISSSSNSFAFTCCTEVLLLIAKTAAVAADCPNTMNMGSMRIEPKAI